MNRRLLIILALLIICPALIADVKIIPSFLPIMVERNCNMVMQLKITGPGLLRELTVKTEGTTNPEEIENISVYNLGTTQAKAITKTDPAARLASSSTIAEQVCFKINRQLEPGDNYIAVSYKISPATNLLHRFGVSCPSITIDSQKHKLNSCYNKPLLPAVKVRDFGDDGSLGYRIPSLVTTNKGTLIAAYDIRWASRRDLQGDMDIGISRSEDGGQTWGPMLRAIDMKRWGGLPEKFNGVSDAGLLVDTDTNTIFCAGLWMHGLRDKNGKFIEGLTEKNDEWQHQWRETGSCVGMDPKLTCQYLMTSSTDDGKTWSEPQNLTQKLKDPGWILFAPCPGHGITLDDGTLVMTAQGRDGNSKSFTTIIYSKDHGQNWQTAPALRYSIGETGLAQLADGSILFNGRSPKGTGYRGVAVSADLGKTWQDHPTDLKALVEPGCMGSLIKYDYPVDGKPLLLFSCPDSQKNREKMTIRVSLDEGMTWPINNQIMLDQFGGAYSCLSTVEKNVIGILYESSQGYLIFQKVALPELISTN